MRFIHLSDLHYSKAKDNDISLVRNALIKDIEEFTARAPIDFVFFTGDLVQSGDDPDNFLNVATEFVEQIIAAAKINRQNFILCPGNHDLSQSAFKKQRILDVGLSSIIKNLVSTNAVFDDPNEVSGSVLPSLKPLESFRAFEAIYHDAPAPETASPLVRVFHRTTGDRKIAVCAFNSAWRSQAGAGNDKERLVLGERTLDAAISASESSDLRIGLMHHPLDWFAPFDRDAIEPRLFQSFDILLYGHLHAPRPEYMITTLGSMLKIQAGAIFSGRESYCGYNIVDINFEANNITIHLRRYNERSRAFSPDTEGAPASGQIQHTLPKPQKDADQLQLRRILRLLAHHIRDKANDHVTLFPSQGASAEDIKDVFVCPTLAKTRQFSQSQDISGEPEILADPSTLLGQANDLAVIGRHDAGKTTLGHLLAVYASEGVGDKLRIPAIVEGSTLKPYEGSLISKAREFLTPANSSYEGFADAEKLLARLRLHPLLIIADNVDIENHETLSCIQKLKSLRPQDRWIILANSDASTKLFQSVKTERLDSATILDSFEYIYMHDLPRHSIRELVRRRSDLSEDKTALVFPWVMQQLENVGLPHNGYVVSVLAWHGAQNSAYEILGEASLIKSVVDHMLDRGNFRTAVKDFSDPILLDILLSEIAKMLYARKEKPTLNEIDAATVQYFRSKNWTYPAGEVIRALIGCRLLEIASGRVQFRLDCYAEYYVAKFLLNKPKKLAEIIAAKQFEEFSRPLELLTSITKQDFGLIAAVEARIEEKEKAGVNAGSYLSFATQKLSIEILGPPLKELKQRRLSAQQVDEMIEKAQKQALARMSHKLHSEEEEPAAALSSISDIDAEYGTLISLLGHTVRNAEALGGQAKEDALAFYMMRTGKLIGKLVAEIDLAHDTLKEYSIEENLNLSDEELQALSSMLRTWIPYLYGNVISGEICNKRSLGTIKSMMQSKNIQIDQKILLNIAALRIDVPLGLKIFRQIFDLVRNEKESNKLILLCYHHALSTIYQVQEYDLQYEQMIEEALTDLDVALGHTKGEKPFLLEQLRQDRVRRELANNLSKSRFRSQDTQLTNAS